MKRRRLLRRLWILPALLLGAGLLFPAAAWEPVTASPGYTVASFATGLQGPAALALVPLGPFGGLLYVVDHAPGADTGRLVALDPSGLATSLVEGLERPAGLVVSAGGTWGSFAYVLEGQRGWGSGLRVVRVSPEGKSERFPSVLGAARAPGGLLLTSGDPWGEALYLSDAAEAELLQMSPGGQISGFLKGLSGPRALALAPPGSPFGEGLYVVAGGAVVRVAPTGQTSAVVEHLVSPSALAFGMADAFGLDLYLSEDGLAGARVLRLSPSGVATPVAQGFGAIGGMAFAPAGPFGPALYVADRATGVIFRITLASP